MEYQFLLSFLSNMDNLISFAIFETDGNCVQCEDILKSDLEVLDQIYQSMKKSVSCNMPIFKLIGIDKETFHCVKTGNSGFIGKGSHGNIMIAQGTSSVSIVFLGQSEFKGSYLHYITRALQQHEMIVRGNIDHVNGSVNNNSTRLKG